MRGGFAALLSAASLAACSVVGIRDTEEPPYKVIDHVGAVEIRAYEPMRIAETVVPGQDEMAARSTGFRRLAGYIFGGNERQLSIAMTAPVAQARAAQGSTIRFVMPRGAVAAGLPAPNDAAVVLRDVPAGTYGVLRFTGSTAPAAVEARQTALLAALGSGPWQASGPPTAWFYDPPWTIPFLRRNEVAVLVERR